MTVVLANAKAAFRTLHFLNDGQYRFDNGPEIDLQKLKLEIIRMARRHDCPDVHLAPNKHARYDKVAAALVQFQRYGCNDLGFRGIESSHSDATPSGMKE